MEKMIRVAINDFKLVFRDKTLGFFLVFPVLNLIVVRYGVPYVTRDIAILKDYVHLILMMLTTQGSLIFGFIYSMVLIDENDKHVAKVYGVLPVSKFWFVMFRLIPPYLLATLSTFLLLLVEPFYGLSITAIFIFSHVVGLTAPMMVLFVAIMAKNKIEGMTWQKLFNIPVSLPLLAFFVPAWASFLFAFLPNHWAYQGLNNLIRGESFAVYMLVGFVYSMVLLGLLGKRFSKTHFA